MSNENPQNVGWARRQLAQALRRTADTLRERRERQHGPPDGANVDQPPALTASGDRSGLDAGPDWFLPNGLFPTVIPEVDGPRFIEEQGGDPSPFIFIHLRSDPQNPVRPAPFGGRYGGGDGYVSVIGLLSHGSSGRPRQVNLLAEDPAIARALANALVQAADTIERARQADGDGQTARPDGELGLEAVVEALVKLRLDDDCDHAYWRQRFELLLDALDVDPDAAWQLRLVEQDAGRSIVPLQGAMEVPDAIAAASHMVDRDRVRRLEHEIREVTSKFVRDVAVAGDPDSRRRTTTLAQLKALGLQDEQSSYSDDL